MHHIYIHTCIYIFTQQNSWLSDATVYLSGAVSAPKIYRATKTRVGEIFRSSCALPSIASRGVWILVGVHGEGEGRIGRLALDGTLNLELNVGIQNTYLAWRGYVKSNAVGRIRTRLYTFSCCVTLVVDVYVPPRNLCT